MGCKQPAAAAAAAATVCSRERSRACRPSATLLRGRRMRCCRMASACGPSGSCWTRLATRRRRRHGTRRPSSCTSQRTALRRLPRAPMRARSCRATGSFTCGAGCWTTTMPSRSCGGTGVPAGRRCCCRTMYGGAGPALAPTSQGSWRGLPACAALRWAAGMHSCRWSSLCKCTRQVGQSVHWAGGVACALGCCHAAGVIHGQ
mmetsp:Transcript_35367/g.104599  ORF Transcript_35367/g.104599 Transcript_35367/m.104599 type:complete len:203 (+) Transcript_35367:535-1143(+)